MKRYQCYGDNYQPWEEETPDGPYVKYEDCQQAIQSAVVAALKAAWDLMDAKNGRMVNAAWAAEAIDSIDHSTIVQSVMQEQALQTLADQAQELDMGYGEKK